LANSLTRGKLVGQDQPPRSFRDLIGHRLVLDRDLARSSHTSTIPYIEHLPCLLAALRPMCKAAGIAVNDR
jgi:hypothetical protein